MSAEPLPPPPWTLRGHGLLVLRWLPAAEVQERLPAGVRLIPLLPGRTLAALFCGHYGPGSTLQYDEMIFSPGLARVQGRCGWWIGDICVDSASAELGGHRFWGLPKYRARFRWNVDRRSIDVRSEESGEPVVSLAIRETPSRSGLRLPMLAPALAGASFAGTGFWARGSARVRTARGQLAAYPGEVLRAPVSVRAWVLEDLSLTITAPRK